MCPWCHARKIERLYRFLVEGPCAPGRLAGKHLFTARFVVPGYTFGGRERAPHVDHAKRAREHWGPVLLRYIRSLRPKVTGGLMLFQVGPAMSQDERREKSFQYEFIFLGEVTLPTESEANHFKFQTGLRPANRPRTVDFGGVNGTAILCSIVPADQPHALRYLLFGTPYKYPVDRLGISLSRYVDPQYGLQGAAALQPRYLFTPEQVWAYFFETKGVRLYDLFGNWRGHRRRRRARHREFPTQDGRRGVLLRRRAFCQKNESRRKEALDRRQELVAKAEPVFTQLRKELGRQPGSPSFKTAMERIGQPVSDRDSRWLVKHLASQIEPSTVNG